MKDKIEYFSLEFLKYPIDKKFLVFVPWVAFIVTGLSAIEGLFLNDALFVIFCTGSAIVFLLTALYFKSRKNVDVTAWIMIINTLILANVVWFRFEGSNGTSSAMILTILCCIALFMKGNKKALAITIVLINYILLFYIGYKFPQLIKPYQDQIRKIVDLIITFTVCGIFLVFVIQSILKSYFLEKTKAEQIDKLKSAFLNNISHEIRTPMNAIQGFSNLITKPDLNSSEKKIYAKFIFDACKSLANMIDEMIDVARIESNQYNILKEKCNINDMITYIYDYYKELKDRQLMNNINFYLNAALPEKEIIIETDPSLLKQVLHNLLDNAFKFTHVGFIELGYKIDSSDLLFYIKDSGIGIPKEECHNLFNGFSKIQHKNDKFYQGIGLGLKLSKKILELLDGKIWVNSEIDKGSTFYFTVPYDNIEIGTH